ncbi:ferrous iron transport protein B [Hazenella coriacea]|uniref:Ferrous iron transport protein B n=1 Tax=Hazenella coriacea TaxID=1179467 RepID=A0A4R3L9H2_9BACL|nr:ferrous iron transport protein B [Hazenella coriacea]TCS95760.1 ferrous iron transport protein B [Hazenella coriacea]
MNTFALFGNPNTGKTSLFNMLTQSYQYVGNWTGVTVEKKVGELKNKQGHLVDLPGIYSLNPLSKDEGVATQYLLEGEFDSILNIVDASQLERNLNLSIQLLEYGKPMLIGLNMIDVANARGMEIDSTQLSNLLGVPIIPITARKGVGCDKLLEECSQLQPTTSFQIDYGPELEKGIEQLTSLLSAAQESIPSRWLAIQFYERNQLVLYHLSQSIPLEKLQHLYDEVEASIHISEKKMSLPEYIRQIRTRWIQDTIKNVLTFKQDLHQQTTWTTRIDSLVLNKFLGVPIFLLTMFLIFQFTFDWLGSPLSDQLDAWMSGPLKDGLAQVLQAAEASPFIQAVVLEGIVAGVGGVLVFVPQIFILFLFISWIEDSGYMARVALVMDRMMEAIGLNGKAFIPMIIGFGCNVPGIMAARTIEQPKERLLTILLSPLMSCSARLSVYSLFVAAFFTEYQALIVLSLYVMGIILAFILAKVFSMTFLKSEAPSPFVIELPPYRIPQWRSLFRSTWEKGKGFIRKAGTFIFGGSVVIWLLGYMGPAGIDVEMNESFLAMIGGAIAPLFDPIGFGNWQAGAALLTGFLAKEVVVSSMNIIYVTPGDIALQGVLSQFFTPLQAYSFMAFILLYVPCLATVAVIRKETGSTKWTWFSVIYSLIVAYIVTFVIYQGGQLLGFH